MTDPDELNLCPGCNTMKHVHKGKLCIRCRIRRETLQEVLSAIRDLEASQAAGGRTVSKGEVIKWLQHELGTGEGRHG